MPKPYSGDLRARVIGDIVSGASRRAVEKPSQIWPAVPWSLPRPPPRHRPLDHRHPMPSVRTLRQARQRAGHFSRRSFNAFFQGRSPLEQAAREGVDRRRAGINSGTMSAKAAAQNGPT
jgi:hypothetical protein